ncbi:hypothetical protein E2C01_043073 [Portunus trituberculatus]|uniref:Uncharacterized protein n=1 Tax=Portunus trituberculatus TaxID=210409 RepID=A0A5B7FUP3_PORTR|nr:hypothetical protein [Portunus trituberculatus]
MSVISPTDISFNSNSDTNSCDHLPSLSLMVKERLGKHQEKVTPATGTEDEYVNTDVKAKKRQVSSESSHNSKIM